MGLVELASLLITAAPSIIKLGTDAWNGYKRIVDAARLKAGSPEERAALDRVEARMHELDEEVRTAKLPD
jgi:hypothetical protein